MSSHIHGLQSERTGKMKRVLYKCVAPFKSFARSKQTTVTRSPIYLKKNKPQSNVTRPYEHVVTIPSTITRASPRVQVVEQDGKNVFESCGNCGFRSYYQLKALIFLAATQLFCGCIFVGLEVTSIEKQTPLHEVASGIWGGCVVIITGIVGLVAAKKNMNWNLIVTFRLMSIMSILFCLGPFITSCLDMIATCWPQLLPDFMNWFIPVECELVASIEGSTIFIAVVETIVGYISAKVTCCCCIPCCC